MSQYQTESYQSQPPYNPQYHHYQSPSPSHRNHGDPYVEQPYVLQPMTSSNVVYVYDEAALRRQQRENKADGGMCLAALCASCLCCCLIPPFDCPTV